VYYAIVHELPVRVELPFLDRLLQGRHRQVRCQRRCHVPPLRERVDYERHVHEAARGGHVGRIRHPQRVGLRRCELARHQVTRRVHR